MTVELTIGNIIALLAIVISLISFFANRKDKDIKEGKAEAGSNSAVIAKLDIIYKDVQELKDDYKVTQKVQVEHGEKLARLEQLVNSRQ